MTINHIVLFEFKADASAEKVTETCNNFLGLRDKCLHPTSTKPYIKSVVGGKDNSPEGAQGGLTHGFVVEFESAEDRDYYVKKDPVHREFAASVGELVQQVRVLDFESGKF
jgi:hypothetical protein